MPAKFVGNVDTPSERGLSAVTIEKVHVLLKPALGA